MKLEVISREPESDVGRPPLLFVHGSCHAAWCWEEHFLDYFARHGYGAHAVSLRGHGQSEGAEGIKWTPVAAYVRDVLRVADRRPRPPVVVGHSLGGFVAQKYLEVRRAPAAVLIAPSPSSGMFFPGVRLFFKHPFMFTKMLLTGDVHAIYSTPARARAFLFSEGMDERKIEEYTRRFGQESMRACLDMMFDLPRPRRVTTPMLVLGAADDAILSRRAINSTGRAYRAEVKIFPGMAHDMMLEDGWEGVADYMLGWLGRRGL